MVRKLFSCTMYNEIIYNLPFRNCHDKGLNSRVVSMIDISSQTWHLKSIDLQTASKLIEIISEEAFSCFLLKFYENFTIFYFLKVLMNMEEKYYYFVKSQVQRKNNAPLSWILLEFNHFHHFRMVFQTR